MIDYKKRLTEVVEILKQLPKEEYEKIPANVMKNIESEKDKEYLWKYDSSKSLSEQNLSRDTVAILSYINMEYLLNDEQKQYMKELHKYNEQKNHKAETKSEESAETKIANYDLKDSTTNNVKNENNNSIAIKPKMNLFSRIINYINKNMKWRK